MDELYQVVAPHFVAGITARGDDIVKTAPIVGYAKGGSLKYFMEYWKRKGWKIANISPKSEHPETPA